MTMQARIDKIVAKVDSFSLRERALIFFAIAALVVSLVDSLFLEPLLNKQKTISAQVVQQQEKMKEVQAQAGNSETITEKTRQAKTTSDPQFTRSLAATQTGDFGFYV